MKKVLLIICVMLFSSVTSNAQVPHLGVRTSQFVALSFPEEIMDVSMSSPHYSIQVKGRYILLKAKNNKAPKTALFIRYGRSRQGYMTEISVVPNAPLLVSAFGDIPDSISDNANIVFTTKQDYYDLGTENNGVKVIVSHLIHQEGKTYIRLYIDNNRPIPCHLSSPSFEHVNRKWSLGIFPSYEGRIIESIKNTGDLSFPPYSGGYCLFVLPSCSSDGLRISVLEPDSGYCYKIMIPERTLRHADSNTVRRIERTEDK